MRKLTSIALLFLTSALILSGCGDGGTPINNGSNLYGQLLSMPESASNSTFTAESMQTWLSGSDDITKPSFNPGVCSGIPDTANPSICTGNINYINSSAQNALFGFGGTKTVKNFITTQNPLGIHDITVTARKMQYTTPGAPYNLGGNTTTLQNVSGALIIPNIPESMIKGVVLFYHGTVLSKFEVPSNFSNSIGLNQDIELSAIYGSQGYIVVVPDYVGQGDDWQVVHPYVAYTETNAKSGIYMLKAARTALESMGITKSLNLYISSYSEGGAYAVKTAQLVQPGGALASVLTDNRFKLTRTVGVSGAYDLTGAMLPFAFSDANNSPNPESNPFFLSPGWDESFIVTPVMEALRPVINLTAYSYMVTSKVGLGSYLIAALMTYNYNATQISQFYSFVNPGFADMTQCFNVQAFMQGESNLGNSPCSVITGGQTYNLLNLFSENSPSLTGAAIGETAVSSAIGSTGYFTNGATDFTSFMVAFAQGKRYNNVDRFLTLGSIMQPPVYNYLLQQNTYDWTATAPLSLIYMHYDSVVTNLDSKAACGLIPTRSTNVKANSAAGLVNCIELDNRNLFTGTSVPGGVIMPIYLDHGNAEAILQLIALHQIESASAP